MSTGELCSHRATSFVRATLFYDAGRQSVRVHRCVRCNVLYFSAQPHALTDQQQAAVINVIHAFTGEEFMLMSSGSFVRTPG